MEQHIVKILETGPVTHDVKYFRLEKPEGYHFVPGQATELSINQPDWTEEKRPFTFTSLNEQPYLEFTIKGYDDHDGVTHRLHQLKAGDELLLHDVWGAISYKGEGYFIAGGAGITPFVAILRQLHHDGKINSNRLFFANKTEKDIIYHEELDTMLGAHVHYLLSKEKDTRYENGRIDKNYLQSHVQDFSKPFYVCGPDEMVAEITDILNKLGANADSVVFEK